MPSRSLVNSFNLEQTGFYNKRSITQSSKMVFQKKTCKISWESSNQKMCYLPPGVPLCTSEELVLQAAPLGCHYEYLRFSLRNIRAFAFKIQLAITIST